MATNGTVWSLNGNDPLVSKGCLSPEWAKLALWALHWRSSPRVWSFYMTRAITVLAVILPPPEGPIRPCLQTRARSLRARQRPTASPGSPPSAPSRTEPCSCVQGAHHRRRPKTDRARTERPRNKPESFCARVRSRARNGGRRHRGVSPSATLARERLTFQDARIERRGPRRGGYGWRFFWR